MITTVPAISNRLLGDFAPTEVKVAGRELRQMLVSFAKAKYTESRLYGGFYQ